MTGKNESNPSLADIAQVAGVHRMTVSRALSEPELVKPATRKHILEVAKNMGYRKNPVVSAVMSQVASKHKVKNISIAFITDLPAVAIENDKKYYDGVISAAKEEAELHGLSLSSFHFVRERLSPSRLKSILDYRMVKGIILNVGLGDLWKQLKIDLDAYSIVAMGGAIRGLHCDTIHSDINQLLGLSLEKVSERGCKRAGICYFPNTDELYKGEFRRAIMDVQNLYRGSLEIVVHKMKGLDVENEFIKWSRETNLDVIITQEVRVLDWLSKDGVRIPEDKGIVCIGRPPFYDCDAATADSSTIARLAVLNLVRKIFSNPNDQVVNNPVRTLVPGFWVEGNTLAKITP